MQISGYQTMIKEANSYYQVVRRAFDKNDKFSDELVFNIMTMAIEKYLVGLMMSVGIMPNHHVIKSLLEEAEQHFEIDQYIVHALEMVDEYLFICSLDDFIKKVPSRPELETMLSALTKLRDLVLQASNVAAPEISR